MEDYTFFLPVPVGQHVFIHYGGAIREAVYLRTQFRASGICGNYECPTDFYFKVAGVKDEVSVNRWHCDVYYSLKDAKACENKIKLQRVDTEHYNTYTKKFIISGVSALAWIWNKTEPCKFSVASFPTFVFDGNDVRLFNYDGSHIPIQQRWYKTKEECAANNEAKVFTF